MVESSQTSASITPSATKYELSSSCFRSLSGLIITVIIDNNDSVDRSLRKIEKHTGEAFLLIESRNDDCNLSAWFFGFQMLAYLSYII